MEKNRLEKVRKQVFYKHTNVVTKKWGKKNSSKNFFQKHTYIAGYKRWKKIVWKKCEKMFFNKHMNIVTKNGEKKREKNFTRNKRISRAKNGKKSSGKSAKKRFFIKT